MFLIVQFVLAFAFTEDKPLPVAGKYLGNETFNINRTWIAPINSTAPIFKLNRTSIQHYTSDLIALINSTRLEINDNYKVYVKRDDQVQNFNGDIGSQTNQEFNGDIDKQTNIDNSKSTTIINKYIIENGGGGRKNRNRKNKNRKNKNRNRKNKNKVNRNRNNNLGNRNNLNQNNRYENRYNNRLTNAYNTNRFGNKGAYTNRYNNAGYYGNRLGNAAYYGKRSFGTKKDKPLFSAANETFVH